MIQWHPIEIVPTDRAVRAFNLETKQVDVVMFEPGHDLGELHAGFGSTGPRYSKSPYMEWRRL